MGLTPEVMGDDAYGYRWARPRASRREAAERPGHPVERSKAGKPDRPGARMPRAPGTEVEGGSVAMNALFDDDFVTQLVVVRDTDTVATAAGKVAAQVVGRRVPPRDAELVVRHHSRAVPGDVTVAESGISALDTVHVGWAN
jgi:hypothetical protein